jgi:hypothetical protein
MWLLDSGSFGCFEADITQVAVEGAEVPARS